MHMHSFSSSSSSHFFHCAWQPCHTWPKEPFHVCPPRLFAATLKQELYYLFAMRHGHETCKIVDWQFSQSQAEKLGQDVTNNIIECVRTFFSQNHSKFHTIKKDCST